MVRFSCVCALILVCGCGDDGSMSTADQSDGTGGNAGSRAASSLETKPDAGARGVDSGAESAPDASGLKTGVDCMGACELMTGPMCDNGPPSVALCGLLCDSILKGDNEVCRNAFQDFLDCLDPTVEVSCDSDGNVKLSRCQEESDALDPCLP